MPGVEWRAIPEELPMPATEPLSHDQLDALIVRLRLGVPLGGACTGNRRCAM